MVVPPGTLDVYWLQLAELQIQLTYFVIEMAVPLDSQTSPTPHPIRGTSRHWLSSDPAR